MSQQELEKLYRDTEEEVLALNELKRDESSINTSTSRAMLRGLEVAVQDLAESTVEYALLENRIQENNATIQAAADRTSKYVN